MKFIYKISILPLFIFGVFASALASDSYELTQGYQGFYNISKGKDVVIAVIDSGVWIDHPDLKQAIWTNPKEIAGNKKDDDKNGYIDDYNGWNFVDNNNKMDPKNDHGTSVAGIIAGQADNNIGVAGIAPDAKIMPLIVCNAKECPKKAIIDAIKYAANNGAKIINLSLGSNGYVTYSTEYTAAIKYAYDKGVLIVASAGNGSTKATAQVGKNLSASKVSPVCNENDDVNMVVGVGATVKSSYMKTNWSNYSDKYVDVWVRGDDLISTTMPSFSKGLSYNTIDGTSFSAPIISGSAALLISTNPNLKVYQLISLLRNTTPFSVYTLFTNTLYTSVCSIKYFNKEVKNGASIILEASNLKPDITLELKNSVNNNSIILSPKDITILDYNKLKIDTAKLSIPAGVYYINSSSCAIEGKLTVKGNPKITTACDVKNLAKCNATQLIELIMNLLKNRK